MFLTAGLLVLGFARPANSTSAHPRVEVRDLARGYRAATSFEISARGWKRILLQIYSDISRHRLLAISAGVTFYGLLAIFPAVAALVALYGTFADPKTIAEHLNTLSGLFPGGAIQVLSDEMNRITAQHATTLGFTSVLGLVVSLWSANSGTKAIFDALNLVYGEQEKRGFVRLTLVSLAFTAAVIVFVLIALAAVVVVPLAINALGPKDATTLPVDVLRWPVLVLMVALLLSALYRYGPSRERVQWRSVLRSSIIAALGWLVLSLLFSWYAANYGSFNKTYGSLGAIMGFMIWVWLSTLVILIGAELDAKMKQPPGARDC